MNEKLRVCPLIRVSTEPQERKGHRPLMDIRLKGQMDGIEAAREIGDRFNIPSIFMSGYTREDIKERLGIAKPFEYVIKPVQNIDLKNAIESVLLGKNFDR